MLSPPQIEVLDLRHFSAAQLRPLLVEEAAFWKQRLRWDYSSSTKLLLQYLDSRILPGFVALYRSRVCGFCFCVYEGTKAVIGDIYVTAKMPDRLAVSHTLTRHLLEVLEASPDIDRIEAQLLLFDPGVLSPAFGGPGLRTFARLFLECEGPGNLEPGPIASFPDFVELAPWATSFYQPTAELIHTAYAGHIDSEINDQYRTLHGSLRFLHNIVRFPGCGTFDPLSSSVLRDRRSNALIGVILCSRIAPEVAHVTQLCIAPTLRGRGLGRLLLEHCMSGLPRAGYRSLTLTVSEANRSALELYNATGFRTRLRFEAIVIDKAQHPASFDIAIPGLAAKTVESEVHEAADPVGGQSRFPSFARRKTTPSRK